MNINNTPIRTSRNFNINDISIDDIEFKKKSPEFNNIDIINNSSKIKIENEKSKFNLVYGLSKDFENEVKNSANVNLKITASNKTSKDVYIKYNLDKTNHDLIDNIYIDLNKDANVNLYIIYTSKADIKAYHNGIIRVNAMENSNINITVVNSLSDKSSNFICYESTLDTNSKVKFELVDLGTKESISNFYSNVKGLNASLTLNSIYLGIKNQVFDLNYIVHLRGEKTKANINVQGALKDNAIKHFKGTIDFKTGCKKAKGSENENCMLLSDKAKSISLPVLLCKEEDVDGMHSTSSGKVGDKELFYIMSRGFKYKDAIKLLVRANFNDIIENILDNDLKESILNEVDKRLD